MSHERGIRQAQRLLSGISVASTPGEAAGVRSRSPHLPLPPAIVVIGASTGGPQALVALLEALAPLPAYLPVCVTLHMPRDLMPVVAGHVARRCRVETRVVGSPGPLTGGVVCFAPGDAHLEFRRSAEGVTVAAAPAKPRAYCKPAIDNMFTAAAAVFGARTLGVVLSGMGEDGLEGARAIARRGGALLAQDQPSSAVWGMPGALFNAGLAGALLPPAGIAGEIKRRLGTTSP